MIATSIRRRLLVSVAAIQIVGAGLATYLVVVHERHQAYAAFDASLGEQAAVLRSLIEAPEETNDAIVFHREFMALPKNDRFFIAYSNGDRIDGSADWPTADSLPQDSRNVVMVQSEAAQYRALVLQRLPVVDAESEPTSASPTITLVYASPTKPVEAHIRHVELQSILACAALLALSTVVCAWALTRGLRPLRDLAAEASKIDVGRWTLAELEKSQQFSELRPLADALTDLVTRLRAAFDRERQFFGDAAHEMKSSVAIVRSTLQFALQSERSAAAYRVELQDALADTARLQDLVASMLDLARIEAIATFRPIDDASAAEVHAASQRVVDRLRHLAKQKGIELWIDADQNEAWVYMPEEDLLMVLSNLVENAILYSDARTWVTIAIRNEGCECRVSVRDEGCGIAQSALPHIFERFYRGDASRSRATGGVGLGLSITKALVLKAKGSISVQSEEGKGSAFTVVLPTA